MEKRKVLVDIAIWALNIGSSVGIIFANKQVLSVFGFKFGEFPKRLQDDLINILEARSLQEA
jgi:hypothetical protein